MLHVYRQIKDDYEASALGAKDAIAEAFSDFHSVRSPYLILIFLQIFKIDPWVYMLNREISIGHQSRSAASPSLFSNGKAWQMMSWTYLVYN